MRTTLNLDDDVLLAVRERARRQRRTAGAVLSDLARTAMTAPESAAPATGRPWHGFAPLPHRGGTVSNALIDQLRDEELA